MDPVAGVTGAGAADAGFANFHGQLVPQDFRFCEQVVAGAKLALSH